MNIFLKTGFFIALLFAYASVRGQGITLSPQARFSLLTVGPGDELYSAFGHSALRLQDARQGIDIAFNYGTFDFNTDNFYVKFLRGQLPYMLSVQNTPTLLADAAESHRYVWEQEMNLTPVEAQRLIDVLLINYRPENRFYAYHFYNDNCATRLGQVLQKAAIRVRFDSSATGRSYRHMLHTYLYARPWVHLGIDVVLTIPIDVAANRGQAMFLPDSLAAGFARATIADSTGSRSLVRANRILNDVASRPHPWPEPLLLFTFFLVLSIATSFSTQKMNQGWLVRILTHAFWDRLLLAAVGLVGFILLLLWVATPNAYMAWNLNLLWALPTHFVVAWFLPAKGQLWFRYYAWGTLALAAVVLLLFVLLPTYLNVAVIPLVLLLAFRFWRMLIIT